MPANSVTASETWWSECRVRMCLAWLKRSLKKKYIRSLHYYHYTFLPIAINPSACWFALWAYFTSRPGRKGKKTRRGTTHENAVWGGSLPLPAPSAQNG